MNNSNKIKVSFLMAVITLILIFIYNNRFEEKVLVCATPDIIDFKNQQLNKSVKMGRKLFKTLCASCHKLNKKLIGPALSKQDWDFNYFLEYTLNENKLTENKDVKALKINEEYLPYKYDHSFNQLSKENIKVIFEYLNMVDIN